MKRMVYLLILLQCATSTFALLKVYTKEAEKALLSFHHFGLEKASKFI